MTASPEVRAGADAARGDVQDQSTKTLARVNLADPSGGPNRSGGARIRQSDVGPIRCVLARAAPLIGFA
jgi:hypothetical protein